MEAKYHVVTDIECRILHYGTEIGVATPGEDSFIMLKKGKHLLTFASAENEQDSYKVVLEVPENDIEDFIEVQLVPYRDARLIREEDERQRAVEEERRRFEEQHQREEAERERIELEKRRIQEEKKRQEEERREAEERVKRCEQELEGVNSYLSYVLNNEQLEVSETPIPIHIWINKLSGEVTLTSPERWDEFDLRTRYAVVETHKTEHGFWRKKEVIKWCGEPYYQAGPFCFNRAFVNNTKCIDENFSLVFCLDPRVTFSSYKLGVSFFARSIAEKGRHPSKREIILSIVDLNGHILFKKDLQTIAEVFEPLSCFPFSVTIDRSTDDFGNSRNKIVIKYKTDNVLYQTYRKLSYINEVCLSVPIDHELPSKSIFKKSNITGLIEDRSKIHRIIITGPKGIK